MENSKLLVGGTGNQYELGVFLLLFANGQRLPFDFGKEVKIGSKFDDLVIRYEESGVRKYIFVQIKHLDSPDVINLEALFAQNKISLKIKDFEIQKYFKSYLRILNQFDKTKQLEKLVIFTNASKLDEFLAEKVYSTNAFCNLLEIDPKGFSWHVKQDVDKIVDKLRETKSDFNELVDLLLNEKTLNFNDDDCLKYYRYALVDYRILISDGKSRCKFHPDFIQDNCLTQEAKLLKDEIIKRKNLSLENISTELTKMNWKTIPENFDLKDLNNNRIQILTKEITEYLQDGKDVFEINSINGNYLARYHKELKINYAIEYKKMADEQKLEITFQDKFIKNINIFKGIKTLRENIEDTTDFSKEHLKNKLQKMKWIISTKVDEHPIKDEIKLPTNTLPITETTIKDFLRILEFKVGQPSVSKLFIHLNKLFNSTALSEFSREISTNIKNWQCQNFNAEDWIQNEERTKLREFLDNRLLYYQILHESRKFLETNMAKAAKFGLKFTSLKGFEESFRNGEVCLITTPLMFMTCMKIKTFLDKENVIQYVFLDLNNQSKIEEEIECICQSDCIKYVVTNCNHAHHIKIILKLIVLCKKYRKVLTIINTIKIERDEITKADDIIKLTDNIKIDDVEDLSGILSATVKFQDTKITLQKICDIYKSIGATTIINEKMFLHILQGHAIGSRTKSFKSDVSEYINRKFKIVFQTTTIQINNVVQANIMINQESESMSIKSLIENDFVKRSKVIIIKGGAGIGKTSALFEVEKYFKEYYPLDWLLRINLIECTKYFNSNKNRTVNLEFVLDLLPIDKSAIEYTLIKYSLENVGNITILFDAFDEICPDYKDTVQNIVKFLTIMKVKKIILTTRPNVVEEFEQDNFRYLSIEIEPFSVEMQKQYLSNIFKKIITQMDKKTEDFLEKYVNEVLKLYSVHQRNGFTSFPLHLQLLGEIYTKSESSDWQGFQEYIESKQIEPNLPKKASLMNLYEKDVEVKIRRYFNEKRKIDVSIPANKQSYDEEKTTILENLKLISAVVLLPFVWTTGSPFTLKKVDDLQQFFKKKNIGIINNFEGNQIQFLHNSYAEYFLSKYLIEFIKNPNWSESAYQQIITNIFNQPYFQNVRLFLDELLTDKLPIVKLSYEAQDGLITASMEGNRNICRYLLKCGCEPNFTDDFGRIPLRIAIANGFDKVVSTLLNSKAEPEYGDEFKLQYLEDAIMKGKIEIIKQLLTCKFKNKTKLHEVVESREIANIEKILKTGIDIDSLDASHFTAVHYAILMGDLEITELLLRKGANVNATNNLGLSSIDLAVILRNEDLVKLLLSYNANVNRDEGTCNSPLHWASISNDLNLLKILIENGSNISYRDFMGRNCLHLATMHNSDKVIEILLENDVDPNASTTSNYTPLNLAVIKCNQNIVQQLLNVGCDINKRDIQNMTALHNAVANHFEVLIQLIILHNVRNQSKLHTASKLGNIEEVKTILASTSCNLDAVDSINSTALHYSILFKNFDVTRYLLAQGANINVQDSNGFTPLHCAIMMRADNIVQELLRLNADINAIDKFSSTVLHWAVLTSTKIVGALMSKKIDLNSFDNSRMTALHFAVQKQISLDIVKILVENNANVNAVNNDQNNCLHLAVTSYNLPVTQYLIKKHKNLTRCVNKQNLTPLHIAILNKQKYLIPLLLSCAPNTELQKAVWEENFIKINQILQAKNIVNQTDSQKSTALHHAALKRNSEFTKLLLTYNANPNFCNKEKQTPLHWSVISENVEVVKLLLEYGADVNLKDDYSSTPLHWTIFSKNVNILNMLLKNRACNINLPDLNGNTVLHLAVLIQNEEMVDGLLRNKADETISNNLKETSIDLAIRRRNKNILKSIYFNGLKKINKLLQECKEGNFNNTKHILETNSSIVNSTDSRKSSALHYAMFSPNEDIINLLLKNKINVNSKNFLGLTALHWGILFNINESILNILLQNGADINCQDITCNTPLHYAVFTTNEKLVNFLLNNNCDWNSKNIYGITALHLASRNNLEWIVLSLLRKSCNPDCSDVDGRTPLHYAAEKGFENIVKHLLQYSANPNIKDLGNQTPANLAAKNRYRNLVEIFVNYLR